MLRALAYHDTVSDFLNALEVLGICERESVEVSEIMRCYAFLENAIAENKYMGEIMPFAIHLGRFLDIILGETDKHIAIGYINAISKSKHLFLFLK